MKFTFPVKDKDFVKAGKSWGFVQNCVSVARTPNGVAVRDTKDKSKNTLYFTNDEWKAFIDGAKKDEFSV